MKRKKVCVQLPQWQASAGRQGAYLSIMQFHFERFKQCPALLFFCVLLYCIVSKRIKLPRRMSMLRWFVEEGSRHLTLVFPLTVYEKVNLRFCMFCLPPCHLGVSRSNIHSHNHLVRSSDSFRSFRRITDIHSHCVLTDQTSDQVANCSEFIEDLWFCRSSFETGLRDPNRDHRRQSQWGGAGGISFFCW